MEDFDKNFINEFNKLAGTENFIRGKYLIWFFINCCNYIYENIIPSLKYKPGKVVNISMRNSFALVATRVRIPDSLKKYISHNRDKFFIKIAV